MPVRWPMPLGSERGLAWEAQMTSNGADHLRLPPLVSEATVPDGLFLMKDISGSGSSFRIGAALRLTDSYPHRPPRSRVPAPAS